MQNDRSVLLSYRGIQDNLYFTIDTTTAAGVLVVLYSGDFLSLVVSLKER